MKKVLYSLFILSLLLTACTTAPNTGDTPEVSPPAATEVKSTAAAPVKTQPAADDADGPKVTILAPSSTSSIPLILAVKNLPNTELQLFTNHPQASAQFIKDENTVLVTGLSVGVDMFKNGAPIQIFNSNVSGLSYLVGCGVEVNSFQDLAGKEVYIPFEGSPLEETTAFFLKEAGLTWKEDVKPIYAPFDTSTALIKQGEPVLVVLPEPSVSAMAGQECFKLGPSYFEEWNKATKTENGYPQVGAFAKDTFVAANPEWIASFNQALTEALQLVSEDPASAVESVKDQFKLPPPVLENGLKRTHFYFETGEALKDSVRNYYEIIGNPLDEKFEAFFSIP